MIGLHRLVGMLHALNAGILLVCKYLLIVIVAVIAVILIAAVVFRYGLDSALSWAEESSKYLMVWLTFLGAPIVMSQFGHANIDVLLNALPGRLQQALLLLVSLVVCATMGIVLWKGIAFAQVGARQVASTFNLSMIWLYLSVPVGSAMTVLVAFEQALQAFVGIFEPKRGLVIAGGEPDGAV